MDRKFCPFLLLNSCTNSGLSQDNKNNRNRTHALHVNVARLNATLSHDASINKISLIADKSEGRFLGSTCRRLSKIPNSITMSRPGSRSQTQRMVPMSTLYCRKESKQDTKAQNVHEREIIDKARCRISVSTRFT